MQDKRERRERIREAKLKRLEKKILDEGYENLPPHSIDRIHADKWLSKARLEELGKQREQRLKEAQNEPVQLSFIPKADIILRNL